MSVKSKAHSSAGHIEGKADKTKSTDPDAEVGIDAAGMGSFDPFQILSGIVVNLLFEHLQPLKHCLDLVTVNEGAARNQAEFWSSDISGQIMGQHTDMVSVAAGVAGNWTSSGDDTMASVEFLARHVALQELIRAVAKGCEGVGWLIGKATDLMVKVRDQIKQWISELLAKIMERAILALATSWIPVVDAATTAEFIIESAIRIATTLQEIYSLFNKVKDALNTAKQVLADLKDGIDQVHDILGAMGVDVPALTTLSKGVEAISEPIGKAADFANEVDAKIAPAAGIVGEVAGAADQLKGHKPDLKAPHGGNEHEGHGGGQEHGGQGGQQHTPMHGPKGGHEGHEGNNPGTGGHAGGGSGGEKLPVGIAPKSVADGMPGGGSHSGNRGLGASKPLPQVDGKPVNPHHFATMANQGKSGGADAQHGSTGAQHGGAGAQHGGAGAQHGGAGAQHGGAGAQHGGAGAQHGGAGAQHGGAGAQHGGAGLSSGSQSGSAGAATASTHVTGAAPVAEKPETSNTAGPQTVRDHGGASGGQGGQPPSAAGNQGGQPPAAPAGNQGGSGTAGSQGGAQHHGASSSSSSSGSGTGGGTSGARETSGTTSSGSSSGDHGKPSHVESKTTSGSAGTEQPKPSNAESKATSGASQTVGHHDEKHPHGTESKSAEPKPAESKATSGTSQTDDHHDKKHPHGTEPKPAEPKATSGTSQTVGHHDEKHPHGTEPKSAEPKPAESKVTGGTSQTDDHHDKKHATANQETGGQGDKHTGGNQQTAEQHDPKHDPNHNSGNSGSGGNNPPPPNEADPSNSSAANDPQHHWQHHDHYNDVLKQPGLQHHQGLPDPAHNGHLQPNTVYHDTHQTYDRETKHTVDVHSAVVTDEHGKVKQVITTHANHEITTTDADGKDHKGRHPLFPEADAKWFKETTGHDLPADQLPSEHENRKGATMPVHLYPNAEYHVSDFPPAHTDGHGLIQLRPEDQLSDPDKYRAPHDKHGVYPYPEQGHGGAMSADEANRNKTYPHIYPDQLPPKEMMGPEHVPPHLQHMVDEKNGYFRTDHEDAREWASRYYVPNHPPSPDKPYWGDIRWPDHGGAMVDDHGQKIPVPNHGFHNGGYIDRFGGNHGGFAGADGIPYEQRAIPGSNMNVGLHRFEIIGEENLAKKGWKVEATTIAPALDQPGGGLQYVVLNKKGERVSMDELKDAGIIDEI